jgi:hypothetical protein
MNPNPWALGWSAVSTMLTAIAVLLALFVAVRDTLRVSRVLTREAEDRRCSQALLITAWATSESDAPDTPARDLIGNPWYAAVHDLNNSSAAITDVEVELGHLNTAGRWESFRETATRTVLPPGERIDASFRADHVCSLSYPQHNMLVCRLKFETTEASVGSVTNLAETTEERSK